MSDDRRLSLSSKWFIRPGYEARAYRALEQLAQAVRATEPDTLAYLVHAPAPHDERIQSLPPADPQSVTFFEVYTDIEAFVGHVHGASFKTFLFEHGHLFVSAHHKPFTFVEFLARITGFIRPSAMALPAALAGDSNGHPAVMFEVIARDQNRMTAFYKRVFGWNYEFGTAGFAFVRFPEMPRRLLGGIGQADPSQPGFAAGHNFYLQVDDVSAALEVALEAGASPWMQRTVIDGYTIAMVKDPEGNPIGLIEPLPG